PQALLHGLITLQKKIDGERISQSPWYRGEVERDVPIPVLGPDLIDLRVVELTAERTAQGLVEAREETVVKPAKIPAPQPGAAAPTDGVAAEAAPAAKGPSKVGLIRARAKGEAAAGPAAEAAPTRPAAKHAKKVKRAEARPSLVWLGEAGLRELA